MKDEVYIVSGYMRTGTSMMMKALEAGGMEAVFRESRDVMRKNHADDFYDPNEGGLYELEQKDYQSFDFPVAFKGKLIKLLNAGMAKMDVMPKIKVIYMRRDFEEVRQSYQAFFGVPIEMTKDNYYRNVEKNIRILKNRKDTEILEILYTDVIKDPIKIFKIIKDHGWPIDPLKSAKIVESRLYRFRKENLVIGII